MTRIQALLIAMALALPLPQMAAAQQDQTLADIRQELSIVYVEIQRLKRELSTTGLSGGTLAGNTLLERIDAIEAELQRLTARTEQIEFRIESVVRDGSNRIGDLEFRLVELEGGDVSQLGETTTLGGDVDSGVPLIVLPDTGGSELAMGEQADFDLAKAALEEGDFQAAADQFLTFSETYPGSPLGGEANFLRGSALEGMGEMASAARAYLESFSGAPDGPMAAEALYKLGTSLAVLGQTSEACVTLGEVEARFPDAEIVGQSQMAIQNLECL